MSNAKTETRYDSIFQSEASKHGHDWRLLKAQAIAESNLDPSATSPVGAMGLTQFMPATWDEWKQSDNADPFVAEHSIAAQAAYMAWLRSRLTQLEYILAAYNWGIGNVQRVLKDRGLTAQSQPTEAFWTALPTETQRYIDRIFDVYSGLSDTAAPGPAVDMPGPLPKSTEPKSPLNSSTIWINLIGGLLPMVLQIFGLPVPDAAAITAAVGAALNIANRFRTTQPVSFAAKGKQLV